MGYAFSNLEYVPALARRILVVQPDGPQRKAILCALTLWGFEASAAGTLHDATDQLIHQPDFVLVDHQLPDGTCVDLLRRLRRREDPAVVAVMLGTDERWFPELPALRPDAAFRKPLSMTWLHAWLQDRKPAVVRWNAIDTAHHRTLVADAPETEQVS
jgi:DNA-binding response OmpR family regulator